MTTLSCALLVLLVQPAAVPAAATCDLEDNLCKARRHERRAAAATTPDDRAYFLHVAHRSYLFSFDKSGDPAELCAARRAFDASLAIPGQSEKQRESTLATRADLAAREGKVRAPCARVQQIKKQRRAANQAPPLLAVKETPPTRTPAPALTELPPATAEAPPIHIVGAKLPRDLGLMPVPSSRAPVRSGRGLVIAGSVTLGAGVALVAAAGVLGRRMTGTREDVLALDGMIDGFSTTEEAARGDALVRDYHTMRSQTLALALVGGATVVTAAILVGLGAKRMARRASRAALVPVPGGLALGGRF